MASFWSFIKELSSSIPNASAGKVNLYADTTLGVPAMKDEAGVVTPLGGAGAATSAPTTIAPDDAAVIGAVLRYAKEDHKHAITADVAGAITPGDAATEGVSTSFARADHKHSIAAFATPGTIAPDDSASAGAASTFARSDHRHAIVADVAVSIAASNAEGVSASFSRADHTHTIPAGFVTNTMSADMAQATIKGRASGAGTGAPTDLTPAQATAIIVDATLTTATNLPGRLTAVEKTRLNRDRDAVADAGADATGAVDATAVLNTLLAGGGRVTLGIGVFKVNTSAVSLAMGVDGTHLVGLSQRNSILQPNHASQDCISITGDECFVENLRIQPPAAGTRTGGFAVNITSSSDTSGVRNCDIIQMWSGVKSSGSLHYIENCNIREVSQNSPFGGTTIFIENLGDRYIRRITSDSGANQTGNAGIRVKECSSIEITDCNLIHCGTCLDLDPTSTKTIASVKAVNCFFDTSVNGLSINGVAAAGSIYRSNFTACWFGSHVGSGAVMNGVAAGTAQFDGISFSHCEFYGNVNGISCPLGGGAWTADACKIAGNSTAGISITPGTNHFPRIRNCEIGPYGNFGVNGTGINVAAGAYKGLMIQQNAVVNNTTNFTLGAVTMAGGAAEAGWFRITDNAGINPRNVNVAPAVPATNVAAVNSTGFRVLVYLIGGTLTTPFVTVGGVTTGWTVAPTNTNTPGIPLEVGQSITLTFSAAPTWKWIAS